MYGWPPADVWRLRLSQAIRLRRARQAWAVEQALLAAAGMAAAVEGKGALERLSQRFETEPPATLEEEFGAEVAEAMRANMAEQAERLERMRKC